MKKTLLVVFVLIVGVIAASLFLLAGTAPEDVNAQPVSITLDDQFER